MSRKTLLHGALCGWFFAACAAPAPYYVEYPLTRSPASSKDAPPAVHAVRARPPTVISKTQANGMIARVVERPGTGLVSLVYANPRARLGTSYLPVFVSDALRAGARRVDGSVVYPITVSGEPPTVSTSAGGTTISVTCSAERFDEALALIAAMVRRPLFEPKWMAPVRFSTQRDLQRIRGMYWRWTLASEHADQPFAVDAERIAESLAELDQQALIRAHRQLFSPRDSSLVVVGDVPAPRALAAFDLQFGGWQAAPLEEASSATEARAEPDSPGPSAKRSGRKIMVFDDERYPEVTVIQNAPPPGSPDEMAFQVLEAVLSGASTSGLMSSLRYERADAYYARARTVSVPKRGRYLFLETSVSEDTLVDDITEVLRTLAKLRAATVDEAGLASAKASFSAGFAGELVSTESLAQHLALVELYKMPTLDEVQASLDAVTTEDIRRVAERYLDPDHATVIVTGTVASAAPALARLGAVSRQ